MRNAALLLALCALTACSLDHMLIAELDEVGTGGASAGGTSRVSAGGMGGAGAAGSTPSAGSGGVVALGGAQAGGEAGWVSLASGGFGGTILIGVVIPAAGATSETRCSCLSRQQEACGTDGITYPTTDCGDAGSCSPPEIECLHACPCNGDSASFNVDSFTWLPVDCVSMARCADGVVCMTFTGSTFDDTQTPCVTGN